MFSKIKNIIILCQNIIVQNQEKKQEKNKKQMHLNLQINIEK